MYEILLAIDDVADSSKLQVIAFAAIAMMLCVSLYLAYILYRVSKELCSTLRIQAMAQERLGQGMLAAKTSREISPRVGASILQQVGKLSGLASQPTPPERDIQIEKKLFQIQETDKRGGVTITRGPIT